MVEFLRAVAAVGISLDLRGSIQDEVWSDKTLPNKPYCNCLSAGAEQGPGAAEIRGGAKR
jgi:hypothetical protein